MKRLVCLCLCTSVLAACGGGGGTPTTAPNTRAITINVANDGDSNSVTVELSNPALRVGDDNLAMVWRALLLFPLDAIPNSATIVSATLKLNFLAKSGTPAANLGALRFVRFQGNTGVTAVAYFATELAHDATTDVLMDLENIAVDVNATVLTASAASGGDTALGVRIEYQGATAGVGPDQVAIASANNPMPDLRPVLEVVIQE